MPLRTIPAKRRSTRDVILFFLAEWALMFGLWLLLVDNFKRGEMLLGVAMALVAALAAAVVKAENFARFAPHVGELTQTWRIPWYLVEGTWQIFGVLARHLFTRPPSLIASMRFDPGGDDAHSAARRALAVALMTVPPNTVVVGIDRKKQRLILHEFRQGGVPVMARRLGVKA